MAGSQPCPRERFRPPMPPPFGRRAKKFAARPPGRAIGGESTSPARPPQRHAPGGHPPRGNETARREVDRQGGRRERRTRGFYEGLGRDTPGSNALGRLNSAQRSQSVRMPPARRIPRNKRATSSLPSKASAIERQASADTRNPDSSSAAGVHANFDGLAAADLAPHHRGGATPKRSDERSRAVASPPRSGIRWRAAGKSFPHRPSPQSLLRNDLPKSGRRNPQPTRAPQAMAANREPKSRLTKSQQACGPPPSATDIAACAGASFLFCSSSFCKHAPIVCHSHYPPPSFFFSVKKRMIQEQMHAIAERAENRQSVSPRPVRAEEKSPRPAAQRICFLPRSSLPPPLPKKNVAA